MASEVGSAVSMANFSELAALRRQAGDESPEAIRAVAQQFEALFINSLLSQMRQATASFEGGLFDGPAMDMHQQMYDSQLANALAKGPGIGLADAIARQLGAEGEAPRPNSQGVSITGAHQPRRDAALSTSGALEALAGRQAQSRTHAQPGHVGQSDEFRPTDPEAFVSAVWPHAERAAEELGIDPQVLVAQAALESGWGQSMIRHGDGRPSYNLFGIKATPAWYGERVQVSTLEFEDGIPERRNEPFRAYPDLASAFDDYVRLIGGRSRYGELPGTQDAAAYARGLQAAGYATDPQYADKIIGILERGLPGRPQLAQESGTAAYTNFMIAQGAATRPGAGAD